MIQPEIPSRVRKLQIGTCGNAFIGGVLEINIRTQVNNKIGSASA